MTQSAIHFGHISDCHLGRFWKNPTRFKDFFNGFGKSIQLIMKKDPEVEFILITGDLFEMVEPNPGIMRLFYKSIGKIIEIYPDLKFYVIPGNHDLPRTKYAFNFRYSLQNLRYSQFNRNIIFLDNEVGVFESKDNQHALIFGFRWRKVNVMDDLKAWIYEDKNVKTQLKKYPDAPKILMMHQYTSGMQTIHESAIDLNENELSSLDLGFEYIGIGHNHFYWDKPALNMYCSGSTEHWDKREWREPERCALTVKISPNGESGWITEVQKHTFITRIKYVKEILLGETSLKEIERAFKKEISRIPKEAAVYFIVKGVLPSDTTKYFDKKPLIDQAIEQLDLVEFTCDYQVVKNVGNLDIQSEKSEEILEEILRKKFQLTGNPYIALSKAINDLKYCSSKTEMQDVFPTILNRYISIFQSSDGELDLNENDFDPPEKLEKNLPLEEIDYTGDEEVDDSHKGDQ